MSRTRLLFGAVIVLFLFTAPVLAQTTSATDNATPASMALGAHPLGSYGGSDFDKINLFNGNVALRVPLASLGGRAGLGATVFLTNNAKFWRLNNFTYRQPANNYIVTETYPTWNSWDAGVDLTPGWRIHVGQLYARQAGWDVDQCSGDGDAEFRYTLTRFTFVAPDGTEYELRDTLTSGAVHDVTTCINEQFNRGTVFVTADGSSATFIADSPVADDPNTGGYGGGSKPVVTRSGVVILRDGTRFGIDSRGLVVWQQDRNGNRVNFVYDGFKRLKTVYDTLGRSITIEYDVDETSSSGLFLLARVTVKGTGGAARITKVVRGSLQNTLRDGGSAPTLLELFPGLSVSQSQVFNPWMVKQVLLPSGHAWNLRYSRYGEIARVETPAGGAVEFDIAAGAADNPVTPNEGEGCPRLFRYVAARRSYANAASAVKASRTTYSDPSANYTIANANAVVREEHYDVSTSAIATAIVHTFSGQPVEYEEAVCDGNLLNGTGYENWMHARETRTETIAYENGSPVTKAITDFEWVQKTPVAWATLRGVPESEHPPNDVRLASKTTTNTEPAPDLVARMEYEYDDYNNVTVDRTYDYKTAGSGTPAPLLRRVERTYVHTNPINNLPYRTDTSIHLRSLVATEKVYGPNTAGAIVLESETRYEYDNYAPDGFHDVLLDRTIADNPSTTGFDESTTRNANFTAARVTRGNATRIAVYSPSGALLTQTHTLYDVCGNAIKTIDPKASASTLATHTTEFAFDPTYYFAFPTATSRSVTEADTSVLELTTSTVYDFNTGAATETTGYNGEWARSYYVDALDRPTRVERQLSATDTAWVQYSYSAPGQSLSVQVEQGQTAGSANGVWARATWDGLGRVVTEEREDAGVGSVVRADTYYDGLGRAWLKTNPYRPAQVGPEPTYGWTRTLFDNLGRVLSVASFDNTPSQLPTASETPDTGQVTSTYAGPTTLVTDQQGKQRQSRLDALGRVVEVREAPLSIGFNYATTYAYDGRGDLLKVVQGSQSRTFVYDGAGRMTSATLPESGTTGYTYDAAGNLLTTTDPRGSGFQVTLSYDELNRLRTRNYANTSVLDATLFYDTSALPSDVVSPAGVLPPSPWSRGASKGRLVGMVTNATSALQTQQSQTGSFYGYDLAGRVLAYSQLLEGTHYQSSTVYDIANRPTQETYPALTGTPTTIGTSYNAAGQLSGVTRNGSPVASALTYSAAGGLTQEMQGSGLTRAIGYNSRLQPVTIKLGTGSNPSQVLQLAYSYGQLGASRSLVDASNNGNVGRLTITPGLGQNAIEQDFEYDPINRLKYAREYYTPAGAGDFAISASPASLSIARGNSGSSTITSTVSGGFNSAIALSATGQPAGVTVTFSPATIAAPGSGTSTMTIAVGSSVTVGTYPITVTGVGGSLTRTTTVSLTVTSAPTPNFTISAAPTSVSAAQGASGTSTITTAVSGGFNSSIALSATGQPAGATVGFSPSTIAAPGSGTSTMTITVGPSVTPNTYSITVTGTGGSLTRTTTVSLTVTAASSTDKSLSVSGTGFVAAALDSATLSQTGTMTVEAWIQPAQLNVRQVIVSKRGPGGSGTSLYGGYELRLNGSGKVVLETFNNTGASLGTAQSAGSISQTGQWYHVAGTVNATGQLTAWLNAVAGTPVAGGTPKDGDTKLQLGRAFISGAVQDPFSGRIDEVRISDVVRTITLSTSHTPDSDTMALWKMQDAAGVGTGADASGNNSLSTLTGTSWAGGVTSPSKRKRSRAAVRGDAVGESSTVGASDLTADSAWGEKLALATTQSWVQEFAFDRYGNRTWGAATTLNAKGPDVTIDQATNRLSLSAGASVTYDTAGNVIGETAAGAGRTYDYTAESRIWRATVGSTVTKFAYDGEGRRVKKTTGGVVTRYVYDVRGSLVAEYTGSTPTLSKEYLYAASGLLAVIDVGGTDPGIKYVTPDHLGTPRVVTDGTGAVKSRHDNFPFGEELFAGMSGRTTGQGYLANDSSKLRQKYTGHERDVETGLDFAQARYLSNAHGRFTSPDWPIIDVLPSNPQSWNRYVYVRNNPLSYTDPTGHNGIYGPPLDDRGIPLPCADGPQDGPEKGPVQEAIDFVFGDYTEDPGDAGNGFSQGLRGFWANVINPASVGASEEIAAADTNVIDALIKGAKKTDLGIPSTTGLLITDTVFEEILASGGFSKEELGKALKLLDVQYASAPTGTVQQIMGSAWTKINAGALAQDPMKLVGYMRDMNIVAEAQSIGMSLYTFNRKDMVPIGAIMNATVKPLASSSIPKGGKLVREGIKEIIKKGIRQVF